MSSSKSSETTERSALQARLAELEVQHTRLLEDQTLQRMTLSDVAARQHAIDDSSQRGETAAADSNAPSELLRRGLITPFAASTMGRSLTSPEKHRSVEQAQRAADPTERLSSMVSSASALPSTRRRGGLRTGLGREQLDFQREIEKDMSAGPRQKAPVRASAWLIENVAEASTNSKLSFVDEQRRLRKESLAQNLINDRHEAPAHFFRPHSDNY